MKVDLFKHNQEAYEKITEAIADGKKKVAIAHATGTGKSYLITKLFEDYNNDKKLVLVPSTYISDQIQALFEKYNIQNVEIILYQKLIKMSDEDIAAMDYSVIALDEYHHDTSKVWGEKVRKLIDAHPESIIFGTSATPIRTDGINTIDELFEGNCASDLPLSESIAKKIVPLPKYVGVLYTLDDELEKLRQKVDGYMSSEFTVIKGNADTADTNRIMRTVTNVTADTHDFDIREAFVDAKNESNKDLSAAEYNAILDDLGKEKLTDPTETFEATVHSTDYRKYWDLGDIVNIKKESWSMTKKQRITEVEEVIEKGKHDVIPTYGNPIAETFNND